MLRRQWWAHFSHPSEDLQVGIMSTGLGCASETFPGIYSRISAVIDWIDENLCAISNNPGPDFGCPGLPRIPDTSEDEMEISIEINLDFYPSQTGWLLQGTNQYGANITYVSCPILTYKSVDIHHRKGNDHSAE
jgi:hypothetical protein